jgi:Ca2+-binding EF-hand superfamily protein
MGNFVEKLKDRYDPERVYIRLRESCPLSDEQLEDLRMTSKLSSLFILKLYRNFTEYLHVLNPDHFDVSDIPENKFKHIPALQFNPLRRRVIACCRAVEDEKKNINFADFVNMMSILNPEGKIDVKLKFAFRLYDYDRDGKIGFEDLKKYLSAVTEFQSAVESEAVKAETPKAGSSKHPSKTDETKGAKTSDTGANKNGSKQESLLDEIYELHPDEILDKVVRKTMIELAGDEDIDPTEHFIKLEDFAKVLLHSDFAGKYALHLNLHHSQKEEFQKILNDLEDHEDDIDDSDVEIVNEEPAQSIFVNIDAPITVKEPTKKADEVKAADEAAKVRDSYANDDHSENGSYDNYDDDDDEEDDDDPYAEYMNSVNKRGN